MTYHIFIGYDEREHTPFQVAKHTLESHATVPIKVHKLHHRDLRKSGLFTRPWKIKSDGTYECLVDSRPFSTQFSHSRFLVPELWRNLNDPEKNPLTIFVDCDVLFKADIGLLFKQLESGRKTNPVYCVQHNYKPENTLKMDGCQQFDYNMKLWSSFVVFDMSNEENAKLTPEEVNTWTGRQLHSFNWISNANLIGVVPESWNFIPNHSEKNSNTINMIHYTEGGPWFKDYRNCRYGDLWYEAFSDYLTNNLVKASFNTEKILEG